ncbi:hypothetical protein [Thiolapillus sp.]
MSYKTEKAGTDNRVLFVEKIALSALVIAMGMTTDVAAGQAEEEQGADISSQYSGELFENPDIAVLRNNLNRAGITLTPETVQRMLDAYPDILEAGDASTSPEGAAAAYPAKFEVAGRDKIYEDTNLNTKNAGGRFTATGIDVLLNYTSVLNGVSYENMAVWGTSHNRDIEAKLAVDAEFEAYGVYGRADAGPPPFPAVTYGVYGTTNQKDGYGVYAINTSPQGNAAGNGGGVALFATGTIRGKYTAGGSNHIDNHVAIIENKSSASTRVLALSMPNDVSLGVADNFITFYHGGETASDAVGAIEGNSGGITYKTGSADFAEWLPRSNPEEVIEAGDIVGVTGGRVSRDLANAEHVQVISTAPAFTGNDPGYGKRDRYALVSMMGQVPVKVVGTVKAGDYIVASGNDDGTGIAISAEKMTPEYFRMMVGRAWESSDKAGMKLINTAVGMGASDAYVYMRKQDQRIASLEKRLARKMDRLDRLAARMEALNRKVAYIQSAAMMVRASERKEP